VNALVVGLGCGSLLLLCLLLGVRSWKERRRARDDAATSRTDLSR